jgi:class I fructose-bisphosphate aldolase
MKQGAKDIVFGRNIIQHKKKTAMTQALMSIVQEGVDVKTALARLERN